MKRIPRKMKKALKRSYRDLMVSIMTTEHHWSKRKARNACKLAVLSIAWSGGERNLYFGPKRRLYRANEKPSV